MVLVHAALDISIDFEGYPLKSAYSSLVMWFEYFLASLPGRLIVSLAGLNSSNPHNCLGSCNSNLYVVRIWI